MASLWDYISPTGKGSQDRSNWLRENVDQPISEAARYYLGAGNSVPNLLSMFTEGTPTESFGRASQASQEMFAPDRSIMDRVTSTGNMLGETLNVGAGLLGTGQAARTVGPALEDTTRAVGRNIAERLNQRGPMPTTGMNAANFFSEGATPIRGIGDNGGPRLTGLLDSVNLSAGSSPRYLGAAPDRSGGSFPRYEPKNVPPRMMRLQEQMQNPDSPLFGVFDEKIAKGQELAGSDWYNTEELRDWFTGALGEKRGDAEWRDYISKIGATSTGAKVPTNIRVASFYRALGDDAPRVAAYVNEKGVTPRKAAEALGIKVPNLPEDGFGYGHIKQRGQAQNIVKQAEGRWEKTPPEGLSQSELTKWLQANPKVKGFTNSLMGDKKNIAADMHFMRLLAMADGSPDFLGKQVSLSADNLAAVRGKYGDAIEPYITVRDVKGKPVTEIKLKKAAGDGVITDTSVFKDMPSAWADVPDATEYGAYEDLANLAAQRYNMTPAQFQANLWMGAGDLTGLADESQGTFMDLFRRTLDKRGGERGLSREEMLKDFIFNKSALSVAPVGMGLLSQTGNRSE
jgi:hypothetical protein